MKTTIYLIQNKDCPEEFYNHNYGWLEGIINASVYDEEGKESELLPLNGRWVKFKS